MSDETTPEETAAATDEAAPETTTAVAEPSIADGLEIGSQAIVAYADDVPTPAPKVRGKVDRFGTAIGTGRRKTAVARVRIKKGDGKLTINGRSLEEFCNVERDRKMVEAPLVACDQKGKVDVWIRVNGGGTTGQTGAMVLGIARALQAYEPELHHILSEQGFLTRDGRMVERKKYGLRKARRSYQFSKR